MNSLNPDSGDTGSTFTVRDCALIMVAAGCKAQNLRELRGCLDQIPLSSLYHHFWGRLLRAQFDEPEYNNDFASWSYHALHDKILAERLSVISPSDYPDLDALRQELIEIIEEHLDERETVLWSQADQQFYFMRGQMVVFDSGLRFCSPPDLLPHLDSLSVGNIFYHFIDARSRTPQRCDDFSTWLMGFGDEYADLIGSLRNLDPYFSSLKEIRQRVKYIFSDFFSGGEGS
jgi:hypothetical protein